MQKRAEESVEVERTELSRINEQRSEEDELDSYA